MRACRILIRLLPLVVAATSAAAEQTRLPIAWVFDTSSSDHGGFGRAAELGFEAAGEEVEQTLGRAGGRLVSTKIETGGLLSEAGGEKARSKLRKFLGDGGRIVIGGATTQETNQILTLLQEWASDRPQLEEPLLLFAPVATSILEDESRKPWNNRTAGGDLRRVLLFRVAVSDAEALRELFGRRESLRYQPEDEPGHAVVPSQPALQQQMVLFVQFDKKRRGPIYLRHYDRPRFDDLQKRFLDLLPIDDYAKGFLRNLQPLFDENRKVFVQRMVIVDQDDDDEWLRAQVERVVRDESIRAVGLVGYGDFVHRINGAFQSAEAAFPRPRLFRFTGGTTKVENLFTPPPGPGSFLGLHFLRTIPVDCPDCGEERRILRRIASELSERGEAVVGDAAERIDDHSVHAYLAMRIIALAFERAVRSSGSVDYRQLAKIVDQSGHGFGTDLEVPFHGTVRFGANGDVIAPRHVYYVGSNSSGGYRFYQTDVDHERPGAYLFLVLGLGFVAAVVVLVNWKRILGPTRVRVGKLGLDNPYVYGVPVTRPEMYYGRRDAFRKVVEEIKGGCFVLLITGGRRSGKSSFLHFIAQGDLPSAGDGAESEHRVPKWVLPIYIDLQKLPNHRDEESFLRHMLEEPIVRAAAERGLELGDDELPAATHYQRLSRLLEHLREQRPQWMVLLLFDELELLNDRFADGTLSESFPRMVRSWVQGRGTRLSAIFTGSPLDAFDSTSRQLWSPLGGMMKRLNLGPLSYRETTALASEPIAHQVIVEPAVQEEIFHLSGGHPFLCQAICHMAVNALNLEGVSRLPARMGEETVQAAVEDFVENTPGHVDDMWSRFSREERYLLLLMGKRLVRRDQWVDLGDLLDFARQQQVEVRPEDAYSLVASWERTLESLSREKRFLEVRQATGRSAPREEYRFQIDLMRRWVQRKPIWPVIDELRRDLGAGDTEEPPGREGVRA